MNFLFKTAELELEENKRRLRMSTGFRELDALIGGIEEGMFYLFYGEESVLDIIVHMLIVNCVLERKKGGFESKGIYFNNTNYYESRTVLDPSLLGEISKKAGVDPKTVLENFYTVVAYNEERQLTVAEKVCDLIRDDSGIRLLIAHNLTVFLKNSNIRRKSLENFKKIVNMISETSFEHNVAVFATVNMPNGNGRVVPEPNVGAYLRHRANVIVYVKKLQDSIKPLFKACLLKHPYYPKKSMIIGYGIGGDFMGRITPSFRQRYENEIEELRKKFQDYLIDLERGKAFDMLLKEAWNEEQAAMGNSNFPTILDALNFTANLQNRKLIEELKKKVEEQEKLVQELTQKVDELRKSWRKDEK